MEEDLSKLENFISQYKSYSFKKKSLIIKPEMILEYIFYLKEGYIRMYLVSENGKELTLNIFKPGSYFPMTWAIGEIPNIYYYETLTDAEMSKIPKEEILYFLKREPIILYSLTKRIIIGLAGLLTRMEILLFGNAYSRVTSTILLSARRFGVKNKNGEIEIALPLTHQEIANLSCLTRETTTIEVEKLARKGFVVSRNKKIIIKDIKKLETETLTSSQVEDLSLTF